MELTRFNPFTDSHYETGNQVPQWVLAQARAHFAAEAKRKSEITDAASFAIYRKERRERFAAAIGGIPEPGGELEPKETGRLRREGYEIRKLIYRIRRGYYGTGNLYVPVAVSAPAPGVLMACGHSREGKAMSRYQQVCISLVRAGFVVLIVDSPSLGEMVQCLDPATGEPVIGVTTQEHNFLQGAASPLGWNIMRDFIANARRGLDLLCGLPEVDVSRIGVTGNSGGGHLTQALLLTDDRICAAVSCCSQTTRGHYLETGVRNYDGEQNVFGSIPEGLDYEDFFAAFAPRPLLIGAAAFDYFPIEGVIDAVGRARQVYRAIGAEDRIALCVAEQQRHGYTAPLRKACVEWFSRHLMGRPAGPVEDEPAVEEASALQCTRTGQLVTELSDARSLLMDYKAAWMVARQTAKSSGPLTRDELRRRMRLPKTITAPEHVRWTATGESDKGCFERWYFFSEPGIIVTGVFYCPAAAPTSVVVLLLPDGTEGQEPYADRIDGHMAVGRAVLVFDPRGMGSVRMRRRNPGEGLAFRSTEYRVANDHFLLGTSLASRRVVDILRAAAELRSRPDLPTDLPVAIEAHGWPSIYGLLAAAVDGAFAGCECTGLPESWAGIYAMQPRNPELFSDSLLLPELRGTVDIPDLLALAQARFTQT